MGGVFAQISWPLAASAMSASLLEGGCPSDTVSLGQLHSPLQHWQEGNAAMEGTAEKL